MNNTLPKNGFTLVELLIVISIIAILSVIGITVYFNVQKNSRDVRRKEDINAIAKAMEAGYTQTQGYRVLAANMFSQQVIPSDPLNSNQATDNQCPGVCKYCVRQGSAAQENRGCSISDEVVTAGTPAGGTSNSYWIVCANLEMSIGTFYCRSNQQ